MNDFGSGLFFMALACLGLLAALLVCESVQWLVGSSWRRFRWPRPSDPHSLALFARAGALRARIARLSSKLPRARAVA